MPEYIDREKLQKHFENNVTKIEVTVNGQNNFAYLCDHVSHEIRNAPTADVVEVRHGKWIPNQYFKGHYYCSECTRHIEERSGNPSINFPYCHCGAKMDGDKSE